MDIQALHSLLRYKGFHYFSGKTNSKSGDIYFNFSKLPNGRGDYLELRIGNNDHDVSFWSGNNLIFEKEGVDDNRIYLTISKQIEDTNERSGREKV
jgi:hypothetical protein